MLNVNTTIEAIFTIIEETTIINEKRAELIMSRALEVNQNTPPTYDKQGRKHAPFDGYIWGSDTYHGGSYLSDEYDFKFQTEESARLKVKQDDVEAIIKAFPFLKASSGSSWPDSGVSLCYLYLKGLTQAQANRITQLAHELEVKLSKELKEARGLMTEGKQELELTVVSTFTKYNGYTGCHDVYLNLTNKDNCSIVCAMTVKLWDLVEETADELVDKRLSLTATIKDLGNKEYKANRPSQIKLV